VEYPSLTSLRDEKSLGPPLLFGLQIGSVDREGRRAVGS
jgi:hypothetical protein